MLFEVERPVSPTVRKLFDGHRRGRAAIQTVLERDFGVVAVDDIMEPQLGALYFLPLVFLAGESKHPAATDLVASIPKMRLMVAPDEQWESLIRRTLGTRLLVQKRTRLSPEKLDLDDIRSLKESLPEGYEIIEMDSEVVSRLPPESLKPVYFFFGDLSTFIDEAIGYCVVQGDEVASLAYTAFPFVKEFEIQVETIEKHRRKGLATAACAALIEHSMENGLVAHWDAANDASVQLALKLGYTEPDRWFAYFWKE
jgi:GNAT superfamily N-acetyltransferase